jgi:hypothetical protein
MPIRISSFFVFCVLSFASAVPANAGCSLQACVGTCREPGSGQNCLSECLKACLPPVVSKCTGSPPSDSCITYTCEESSSNRWTWQPSSYNVGAACLAGGQSGSCDSAGRCTVGPAGGNGAQGQANAQSWTPLANITPGKAQIGALILLSDGRVLANQGWSTTWFILSPDSNGDYVNGTWTAAASSNCRHGNFATHILMDGSVFVAGGEDPEGSGVASFCANTAQAGAGVDTEIYYPNLNQWTQPVLVNGQLVNPADPPTNLIDPTQQTTGYTSLCGAPGTPSIQAFLDMTADTLPDGSVLMAPVCPKQCGDTLIFNPKQYNPNEPGSGWSSGGKLANTGGDAYTCNQQETSWVKLGDGSILTVDPVEYGATNETTEIYNAVKKAWVAGPTLPYVLYDQGPGSYGWSDHGEMGPAFLLSSGKAIFFGGSATALTAIYDPTSKKWSPTPGVLTQSFGGISISFSADDTSGVVMPNGKILVALNPAATSTSTGPPTPIWFFEYDPIANTFTSVAGPNPGFGAVGAGDCGRGPVNFNPMIMLPYGNVLMPGGSDGTIMGCDASQLFVYRPSGSPIATGKPAIGAICPKAGNSYHLEGSGLSGISEGGAIGDDLQMATNFPIVQLISANGSYKQYAQTSNWSSDGVAASGANSVDFEVPQQVINMGGQFSIRVIANGYPSDTISFLPFGGQLKWNPQTNTCANECTSAGANACSAGQTCEQAGGIEPDCVCLQCSSSGTKPCLDCPKPCKGKSCL